MNKKEENARLLDPMRFKVTKNMPYVQGGPDNNNPMNVTDNASPQIQSPSIYGDFQQNDSPGNAPLDDLPNQTGSIQTQVSSTNVPEKDPEAMETDALSQRLEKMAKGGQGFPGLNNRNREV